MKEKKISKVGKRLKGINLEPIIKEQIKEPVKENFTSTKKTIKKNDHKEDEIKKNVNLEYDIFESGQLS